VLQESFGGMAEGDKDEFKRILLEGNPIFLGITFAVTLLHSVFDVLAFKNDIGFWKDKKSVEGLSVRTILINAVCQVGFRNCDQ
jgi:Cleft lip and palate transmembrane protein 1 (CLPTM1)